MANTKSTKRSKPTTKTTTKTKTKSSNVKPAVPAQDSKTLQKVFETHCREIVLESSVVLRAERVKAAQVAHGKLTRGRPKKNDGLDERLFFTELCRLTGLSRRAVQYDLKIATISPNALKLIKGTPLSNRTRLLLKVAEVTDHKQQLRLAKEGSNITKFKKALYDLLPEKESEAKPQLEALHVLLQLDREVLVKWGGRSYVAKLTPGNAGMMFTLTSQPREQSQLRGKEKAKALTTGAAETMPELPPVEHAEEPHAKEAAPPPPVDEPEESEGEDRSSTEKRDPEADSNDVPGPTNAPPSVAITESELLVAIQTVLGHESLTSREVHGRLKYRGWFDDFHAVQWALSSNRSLFRQRGHEPTKYRNKPTNPYIDGTWVPSPLVMVTVNEAPAVTPTEAVSTSEEFVVGATPATEGVSKSQETSRKASEDAAESLEEHSDDSPEDTRESLEEVSDQEESEEYLTPVSRSGENQPSLS